MAVFVFETKSNISCTLCFGGQRGRDDLGQACQKATGLEGRRRVQLVRVFCGFFPFLFNSHIAVFSSVATVARVLDGLLRGHAVALRLLDKVVARLRGGGGKVADEAAAGTCLTAPGLATAGSCLVSCLFCLFCFHTAALTPNPCPPCFQADAAAAGVVGSGRDVRQSKGCRRRATTQVLCCFCVFCHDASLTLCPYPSLPTTSRQRSSGGSRTHAAA